MHDEMSIWLQAYALFWVVFNVSMIAKSIIKWTSPEEKRLKENEETVDKLYSTMSMLADAEMMQFGMFIFALLLVLMVSLDVLAYVLIYAYLPLEGNRWPLFLAAVVLFILSYSWIIHNFARVMKKALNGAPSEEVLSILNNQKYRTLDRTTAMLMRLMNLFLALQFALTLMF